MKFKEIKTTLDSKLEKGSKIVSCVLRIQTPTMTVEKESSLLDKHTKRTPMEICVVFDVSGSMQGSMKEAKEGLIFLVKSLNPRDIIHLITFSERSKVIFKDKTRMDMDEVIQKIMLLSCESTTNLMSGVEIGKEILKKSIQKKVKHLFVFTDGQINEGVKDKSSIGKSIRMAREYRILVSTFGYTTDYDEDLLTLIANEGGGDYQYIQNSSEIKEKLMKSFNLQTKVSYTDVVVKLIPIGSSKVKKVYNHENAIEFGIPVGTLYDGKDIRNFLFDMELSEVGETREFVRIEITGFNVHYDCDGKKVTFTSSFKTDIIQVVEKQSVEVVDKSKDYSSTVIRKLSIFSNHYGHLLRGILRGGEKVVDVMIRFLKEYAKRMEPYKANVKEAQQAYDNFNGAVSLLEKGEIKSATKKISEFIRQYHHGSFNFYC